MASIKNPTKYEVVEVLEVPKEFFGQCELEENDFLLSIVTGDETWVAPYTYNSPPAKKCHDILAEITVLNYLAEGELLV